MSQTINTSNVGQHFLDFSIAFFNLIRSNYQQQGMVKANTLSFYTLVFLDNHRENPPTMSELAAVLGITKQQFTKIVNDLEEHCLVERIHNSKNRRLVYLKLSDEGIETLQQLKILMLNCTAQGLSDFSQEELSELEHCLETFSRLMKKFKPQGLEK